MNNVGDMINILVKERNQTLADREKQIKLYKNSYNDSQRELTNIKNQLNNKQNEIDNIQNQLNNSQIQLNNIQVQLVDTQNKLKNAQYQIQNLQNQLIITQNELQIEKNCNKELKLKESNQTMVNKKIDSLNSEIIDMRVKYDFNNKKIVNLMDEIKQKDNELNKLNSIITKFSKLLNPINIKFRSSNSSIVYEIICYYSEIFLNVEEKLYQNFPELRNKNNLFLFNGNKIEKEKSIILNEITNSSVILIINQS
jgi:N-terminal acetyltransferase B complex non-catalytic subunit